MPKPKLNLDLLAEICEAPGAPGFEDPVRKIVLRELKGLADSVEIDHMGNVTAIKKGKNRKKFMVAAHMDEIGFMVKHIDDQGFLRFTTLGGFDPKTLTAQRVVVQGKKERVEGVMGAKPIHKMTAEERQKPAKMEDFFVDLGMSKKAVEKLITVGDSITMARELKVMGDCVNCKALDNRVSVYILIEVLKQLKKAKLPWDFYAVFTVQEEVGLRGAKVAAHAIKPDAGIGLDTTIAYDVPGAPPQDAGTRLGEGVGIKVMDSASICDPRMVDWLSATAKKAKIKHQRAVLIGGGNDTAALQAMTPGGTVSGSVCIPTRHIHQSVEMCNQQDILDTIALMTEAAKQVDKLKNEW